MEEAKWRREGSLGKKSPNCTYKSVEITLGFVVGSAIRTRGICCSEPAEH
jgi:hypothetical protein